MIGCTVLLGLGFVTGCGGNGEVEQPQMTALYGALDVGDVRILDDQLMDPWNFEVLSGGPTVVTLETIGFTGLLRVHDTQGNLVAQSIASDQFNARVQFVPEAGWMYAILVVGATSESMGDYVLRYPSNLLFESQIKGAK
jgi:hypothetical protein